MSEVSDYLEKHVTAAGVFHLRTPSERDRLLNTFSNDAQALPAVAE